MTPIPAVLTVDSREQLPYRFCGCSSKHVQFEIVDAGLPEGDYAAHLIGEDSPELTCVIERKSHSDLLGTLTAGRERFEAELERLRRYGFKAIVIEASLSEIVRGLPGSKANSRSIVASLLAFAQRFGVHTYFGDDRRHSEALTYRILERWVRDRHGALKNHATAERVASAGMESIV